MGFMIIAENSWDKGAQPNMTYRETGWLQIEKRANWRILRKKRIDLAKYIKEKCLLISMDDAVGGSVYNIIEVVGSSSNSWEEAVKNAVDAACERLTNLRIAEIVELDTKLSEGNVIAFRAKVRLSFKHEIEPETL